MPVDAFLWRFHRVHHTAEDLDWLAAHREHPPTSLASLLQRRVPHAPGKRRRGRRRYSWAELLARVFLVDVFVCPNCGGTRRLLAAIHDPDAIVRVLAAMGLSAAVPELAAARSPPGEASLRGR